MSKSGLSPETFFKPETEQKERDSCMSQKFSVKGIFLDLDGTIVDSKEAYLQAARTAFAAIRQKMPKDEQALEIPKRMEQGLNITNLVKEDTKKFLNIYLKTFYQITKTKTTPMPEIAETLGALSQKAKLALITMRHVPAKAIMQELQDFGLAQYFTYIVTALDTAKPKPSPEALIKCVEKMDLDMCDCIIVGDSVNDVRAGKAAGAKTVALLSGLYSCQELANEKPDLILPSLKGLPELLI
jgi:HAD superfamily hydrolase (TIGR01549 family)